MPSVPVLWTVLRFVAPAWAIPGPLEVIGSHAYADLEGVLPGAFVEPGEIVYVRLETVARLRMSAEPLLGVEAFRVDLAARRRAPEITDLGFQIRHIHVSVRGAGQRCERAAPGNCSI